MAFEKVPSPENYEQKLPCVLVLDSSGSMEGRIEQVVNGLKTIQNLDDDVVRRRLELAVVDFNSNANVLSDFVSLANFKIPDIRANGGTNYTAGIQQALILINNRKSWYKETGQTYYRPYIIFITDGEPQDSVEDIRKLNQELNLLTNSKHLKFWAFGIDGANIQILQTLTKGLKDSIIARIEENSFSDFFEWLSNSMEQITNSNEGDILNFTPTKSNMFIQAT